MSANPVRWFEIYVQDMPRARNFYENVLRLKTQKLPTDDLEMWAFDMKSESYGSSGALVKMQGVPSGCGGTLVYFGSDDCAIEEALVEKHGGKIHKNKFSIGPYGFITLAYDTEGNMIGFHSMK